MKFKVKEAWKTFKGYQISNLDNVKGLRKDRLKLRSDNLDWYPRVRIYYRGTNKIYDVHVLVMELFGEKRPSKRHQVNHKDGDKKNPRLDNLEWVTPSENMIHAWKTGLCTPRPGLKHHNVKLKEEDVYEIKRLYSEEKLFQRQIAEKFGIQQTQVSRIILGKRWKHLKGEM